MWSHTYPANTSLNLNPATSFPIYKSAQCEGEEETGNIYKLTLLSTFYKLHFAVMRRHQHQPTQWKVCNVGVTMFEAILDSVGDYWLSWLCCSFNIKYYRALNHYYSTHLLLKHAHPFLMLHAESRSNATEYLLLNLNKIKCSAIVI